VTPEAIEEERRLLYVGMTRAREDLALSWAQARNPGQAARRKPSRFLLPLLPEQARSRSTSSSSRRARMCSVCGTPLSTSAEKTRGRCQGCPAPYDEELFERLREWRRERAKTDEVAAFMVFSNRTLEEVAEHRPQTPGALLEINGIGPDKLQKYGDDLLDILA
jgi:DNA helicase II / ATP-dependent DNA helicase PcrA